MAFLYNNVNEPNNTVCAVSVCVRLSGSRAYGNIAAGKWIVCIKCAP